MIQSCSCVAVCRMTLPRDVQQVYAPNHPHALSNFLSLSLSLSLSPLSRSLSPYLHPVYAVCRIGEKATKLYVLLVGNVVLAEPVGGSEPSGRNRRLAPPAAASTGHNTGTGGTDASETGSVHDGASSAALSRNTSRSDMTLNRTPSSVALDGRELHPDQGQQRSPRGGQEKVPITVDPAIQTMLSNTGLVPVAMLGVGDNIGAFNLLRGAPLSQTAVVAEDTEFLTLSKRDYDRTLRARAEKLLQEKVDFVSNLPAFARSTRGYVTQFAHALVSKTAPRNTVLVQQNSPVDMIYFVKSGDCRLTITVEHTKEHKFPLQHTTRESTTLDVATVGPGELVGASECLQGLPYSGTVIASTTIEYLEISRNEFVQKMGQETRLEVIRAAEPKMARRLERCQQLLDLAEKKVIQPLRTTFLGERLTYPMELMRKDTNTFCITPRLSKQIHASFQASPHTSLRERAEARIHGKALAQRGPQHQMPTALNPVAPLPSTAGSQVGSLAHPSTTASASGRQKSHPHPPSSTQPPPSAQSPRAGVVSVAASQATLASKHSEPASRDGKEKEKESVTFVTGGGREAGSGMERSLPFHNKLTGRVSFGHRRMDTLDSMAFDSDDSDEVEQRRGDGMGGVDWEGPRSGGAWDFAPHYTVPRSVPKASRSYRSIRAEKAAARLVSRRQAAQESANARNLARTRITKVLLADALSRTGNFRIRDHMSPDTEGVILQPGAARIGRRKAGSTNAATLAEYEALFAKPKTKTARMADGTVRLTAMKRIETEKLLSPRP
eukprot:TRINITY_DN2678_c0_g1_i2.p1 TRINITY_DN2678_c0_g1~~TRINITY_DN2678_c0_g1_i2.p1  ORF type:complete len:781 (-),score=124.38 TRINITY_DN2678_c0_g1_i2:24-2366(-)